MKTFIKYLDMESLNLLAIHKNFKTSTKVNR